MRATPVQRRTAFFAVLLLAAAGPAISAQASGGAKPPATTAAAAPAATSAATAPAATTAGPAAAPSAAKEGFSKDQLEQLVAPIALYSDSLLMQILMAATYPIEVVEAERFMTANPGLKDAKLDEALKDEDWDPSVKSMCKLPDVLKKMSENLDWTQDLGDAFLGQKAELLDTVQVMRGKANDSGNLKSNEKQVVTVTQEKIIVIESPSPEVVYVPTYSPTVVYAGWAPPSYYYPPMYPYYPPGAGLVSFGVGMAVGAAIWGDCHWGWGHSDVNINVDRYNNFNRNTNINADRSNLSGNRSSWQHDASHRKGVNYQNSKVAGQYGAKAGSNRAPSTQARGYSGSGTGTRQARTPGASAQTRTAGSGQGAAARDKASASAQSKSAGAGQGASRDRAASAKSTGTGGGQRTASASQRSSSGGQGRSAYSGASSPSTSRASSSRGASSRGTASYGGGSRSYGGGSRSYGGGSRGGGGGRRR